MAERSLSLILASGLSTKAATTGSVPVRSSLWGMIREPAAGDWQKGITVDPIGSITSFGAVFACIARIATDIAKLELELMQEDADGIDEEVPYSSPFWRVLRRPNHYQNRIQFLTYWLTSKLLYGNTYAVKQRDMRGIVTALYLLDPRRVVPMVTPQGVAPAAEIMAIDSRTEVPAEMTSSTMRTRPDTGAFGLAGSNAGLLCAMAW